jgi:hypothetical protein
MRRWLKPPAIDLKRISAPSLGDDYPVYVMKNMLDVVKKKNLQSLTVIMKSKERIHENS